MENFLLLWQESAFTSFGLFWMAFWAFGLGYLISSMIQVFVTQQKMRDSMGETGPKSVALGTFFGFISSSCSFAALSTTRALFAKGAGLIPSLAFMLASTNLVVELGIVIGLFLGWQFVVGEYIGGLLLILFTWLLVKFTLTKKFEQHARKNAESAQQSENSSGQDEVKDWKQKIKTKEGWLSVADQYVMEWKMVWKDVSIGFTVAGVIAVFVPTEFFQGLFIGAGSEQNSFFEIIAQTIIGPIAAFFTFIGSMGNIPLAAVLFGHGVSFAGVIAFIFSDLVVFPVLRIQAQYYGWKMALYILVVFLIALITTSLLMHYGLDFLNLLPESSGSEDIKDREFFKLDYSFWLNIFFIAVSLTFFLKWYKRTGKSAPSEKSIKDWILLIITIIAYGWLMVGMLILPLI